MIYEDFPVIAKKLHQQDHKFYGLVSCIAMLKTFLFVGNSSGIIRVFDLKYQKEMKPLLDQSLMKNDSKVTCMDIAGGNDPQHPYGLLLSGYKNGSLALWDLIEYKLLKYIPNIHETDVTNVKIYRVQNNGGSISAISSEDQGGVRYIEINKKAIFGGYNYSSEYLFKNKLKGTTAIAIYQPNPCYPNIFADSSCLLSVGGLNMITICTMKPIDCIYSINKPTFCKEKAIPYIDWGFGLTPSHREKTVPIMAFAWDRIIQLIYINDEGTSLDIDGFYYSDKEIISLSFLGDGIIFAIFEGLDGREAKILYTTKFYPGSYRTIEDSFNSQGDMIMEFERVAQVTMHAELEKSHEILEIRSQVLHSYSQMNYNNSISKHKQNILILGQKTIQRGRLFSWKEYIEHIQYGQGQDWLSVLKVALEIYNGDIKGYALVPDEKEVREEKLQGYMQDLIKTNIQQVLQKFKKKEINENTSTTGSGSSSGEYQADQIAIKVAIEFCLSINTPQFLFSQMLELFELENLRQKFIQNLEVFIISGQFRKEYIPEEILAQFLSYYETKGYDLQERNLERIVQQLDLKQYSDLMRARLEILCETNCMVSALIALQGSQNSIITTMFKLMKKVGLREKKEQDKGILPYLRKDIQMLFIVDSKKKYEIEKSKSYIGYKLLWIMKMYLEGRQFPYGSLQNSQWELHVNQIASLLGDDTFLREFLDFDSKCFFEVIQKLFYGEPFQFIAYKKSNENYPMQIIKKIQETVEQYTKKFKAKINKELKQDLGYSVNTEFPQIMSQFYFFILHVEVEHQRYQVKLKNEIEMKKKKQIQVNQNHMELKLDFNIIQESIDQVLINWSNQLENNENPQFDEKIIIEAIRSNEAKFTISHNDQMLKQLDDLNLQSTLINIRIFLLEQRGDYLQSFRLHMTDDQLKEKVFEWIKSKFSELDKSLDQEKRFNELKSMVASHMKEIIQVDVDQTIELIEKYYDDSYSDQLILEELSHFPEVQFNFLTKFLHFNEVSIKIAVKDVTGDKDEQAKKFNKYLCLQVELMCQLLHKKMGTLTSQVLEKFVEQDHYPVDECLEICKKYNQERAIAALLVRSGKFGDAISTYMNYIKKMSLVRIGSELLQIITDAQKREFKKKRSVNDQIPSTEELIRLYGDSWDYEECYKYQGPLSDFDETIQKACNLAKRSFDTQGEKVGEESWFQVLLVLDQWSSVAAVKLQEEANRNPTNLQILFQSKIGQDLKRVGGLVSDFILRRKNIILMIQVPLSISPETLMDKLNLNLDSIRKIFEFKVKAIKGEKKFIKIANRLIVQEIIHQSEMSRYHASKGHQLEGDSGKNKMMTHVERDICDNCEHNLIQYQKTPIKVYFGCEHTFHQHCITKLQKELIEQAKLEGTEVHPSSQCPKCTKDFANITFEQKTESKTIEQSGILERSEFNTNYPQSDMTETIYNYRMEQFDINMGETMINSYDFKQA